MPNGVRRQRNTRHANRQRNIQRANEVQAHAVQDTPVVQAEAAEVTYSPEEAEEYVRQRYEEHARPLLGLFQELKDKYEKLKKGTLLAFQEVEIEDLQKENEELKEELGLAEEKINQLLRVSEDKMLSGGNKGIDEFVQKTFVKTWNNAEPSTLHVDGHKFTLIPHNCPQLNGSK